MDKSFRVEPFLWIHLAGIGVVPLAWLGLMVILAVATPWSAYGLELLFLVTIAWLPVMIMQWFRPFEIFSLLVIALRPDRLSEPRLKILSLFKRSQQRWLTLGGGLLSLGLLWLAYYYAPLGYSWVTGFPQFRLLALFLAAIAYLLVNLFLQVPLSVVGVMLTSQQDYETTAPMAVTAVAQQFTVPGVKLGQIPLVPQE